MDTAGFIGWLSSQRGAFLAAVAPRDLIDRVVREESTVVSIFGTPVDNSGLRDCLEHDTIAVVFTDRSFRVPSTMSMILRNEDGEVVGHNVPDDRAAEFAGRDDVMFLGDDFVLYPGKALGKRPLMELRSKPYRGGDGRTPEGIEPVIWFPSTTSSEIIHRWFGVPVTDLGTALIAANLQQGTRRRRTSKPAARQSFISFDALYAVNDDRKPRGLSHQHPEAHRRRRCGQDD